MNRSESREELRDELARLILGGDPDLTSEEVTSQGGLSRERGERLWRALGFPDPGDSPSYGEPDVEAIAMVAAALDRGILDEDTIYRMTRALGQTMSRLADWQVATLVEQVEAHVGEGRAESRLEAAVSARPGGRARVRAADDLRLAPAPRGGRGPDGSARRRRRRAAVDRR